MLLLLILAQLVLLALCSWTKQELENIDRAMTACLHGATKYGDFKLMKQRDFFCDVRGPELHIKRYAACLTEHLTTKPFKWDPDAVRFWHGRMLAAKKPNCQDKAWGKDKNGVDFRMSFFENLNWLQTPIDFDLFFKGDEIMTLCLSEQKALEMQVSHFYCKIGPTDLKPVPGACNEAALHKFKECVKRNSPTLSSYLEAEYPKLLKSAKLLCNPNPKKEKHLKIMEEYIVEKSNKLSGMMLPLGCFFNGHELKFEPMPDGVNVTQRCLKVGTAL